MATRIRKLMIADEARTKIKTSQLVNRLTDHALGKVKMVPSQVQAINILLRKTIPDLANIALSGAEGAQPIKHEFSWKSEQLRSTTFRDDNLPASTPEQNGSLALLPIAEQEKPLPASTISNGAHFQVNWSDPDSHT